ncbi:MAG: hypothetical protein NTW17_02655 [Candidatus Pacearchaeota archaeon]|nr:hypothetical protein [Candidatus Pacearchaeota archaeon]
MAERSLKPYVTEINFNGEMVLVRTERIKWDGYVRGKGKIEKPGIFIKVRVYYRGGERYCGEKIEVTNQPDGYPKLVHEQFVRRIKGIKRLDNILEALPELTSSSRVSSSARPH